MNEDVKPRVVIDTNILIAAAYNPRSASRRILGQIAAGEFVLIASPAINLEYETILDRAIRSGKKRESIQETLQLATVVTPKENPPVTEDRSDDKFLAAAIASSADLVITNDQHLLAVDPYQEIRIVQPRQARSTLVNQIRRDEGRS